MDENAANDGSGKFSDADERIFALLSVVEDQQTAVRAGIEGLAQERAAMATERVALVQQAEQMKRITDKLVSAIGSAIPQMAQSAGEASREAFRQMLVASGKAVSESVARSAQPELDKFSAAVDSAAAAQIRLKQAVKDFRREWLLVVASLLGVVIVAASIMGYLAVLWQREELGKLIAARDKLTVEVSALQEQAEQAKRNNGRKPAK